MPAESLPTKVERLEKVAHDYKEALHAALEAYRETREQKAFQDAVSKATLVRRNAILAIQSEVVSS